MTDDHSFFADFFGTQGKCTKCGEDCDPDHILCNSCRRPLPAASHDETGQDMPAYGPDPLGYDIPQSYSRPQYSDWRITGADGICLDFSKEEAAEELQADALLSSLIADHDDISADDESLVLWLIVGQDEDEEDILEEMSSYWNI